MTHSYMNRLLVVFLLSAVQTGFAQIPDTVPRTTDPVIPTLAVLLQTSEIDYSDLFVEEETTPDNRIIRLFLYKDKPAEGWVKQVFEDSNHRYRFMKMENGYITWQIGYYDTGVVDHDFHLKNGRNFGSQRMWFGNGRPYIDTYFLEDGIQHGKQKRWSEEGILLRDALFENGTLIYDIERNANGDILRSTGELPVPYRTNK